MLASHRFRWDIGVYNPNHELVLIVEVKTKLNTTADWVVQFRKKLFCFNEIPNLPYFLMAFPDIFYLWTQKDLQQENSQPSYTIDARPFLNRIFETMGVSNDKVTESSFELIIFSWLRRIINAPHAPNLMDSSQDWLIESGLYSAIAGGNLLQDDQLFENISLNLYEKDYGLWAETMADLLESEQFLQLDIKNLVEEIRDFSKRERDKLISSIRLILHHLLKWDYQPQKRSRSWIITIERERNNISDYLEDSPSLRRYLCQEWVKKAYRNARLDAAKETDLDWQDFPLDCPYTIEDALKRPFSLE